MRLTIAKMPERRAGDADPVGATGAALVSDHFQVGQTKSSKWLNGRKHALFNSLLDCNPPE
jgi:hypothetical protein